MTKLEVNHYRYLAKLKKRFIYFYIRILPKSRETVPEEGHFCHSHSKHMYTVCLFIQPFVIFYSFVVFKQNNFYLLGVL